MDAPHRPVSSAKRKRSKQELEEEEARNKRDRRNSLSELNRAGCQQLSTFPHYDITPYVHKALKAVAAIDKTPPIVTTLGGLFDLLTSDPRSAFSKHYVASGGMRHTAGAILKPYLLMAIYYHRSIALPCAPVTEGEFVSADLVDKEKNYRPLYCPRCMVRTSVHYYEPTIGIGAQRQHRLFCCDACLLQRFANRVIFSREELVMKPFLSNIARSGVLVNFHSWPQPAHGIPKHLFAQCWECGDHLKKNSINSEGIGLARCMEQPPKAHQRVFCEHCGGKHGSITDICSFCKAEKHVHIMHQFGLRACASCVTRAFDVLGPEGRVKFARDAETARNCCSRHGLHNGENCTKCEKLKADEARKVGSKVAKVIVVPAQL